MKASHLTISAPLFFCLLCAITTIHGVTRPISTTAKLVVEGKKVNGKTGFKVLPNDFDIRIPSLVGNRIAKEIEISVDVTYTKNLIAP